MILEILLLLGISSIIWSMCKNQWEAIKLLGGKHSRKEDQEGLEPEDDSSDLKICNSSLIDQRYSWLLSAFVSYIYI